MKMLPSKTDKSQFAAYPPAVQQTLTDLWNLLEEICDETRRGASVQHASTEIAKRFPGQPGYSAGRLQHLYSKWQKSGCSWKTLVDRRQLPAPLAEKL